jgi:hypothetical protein
MTNPSENDFVQDDPLAYNDLPSGGQESAPWRAKASGAAIDTWEQTKQKATVARARTEVFMRENPVPVIIGALAVGVAVGWALRYAMAEDEKEMEIESGLGNVNWSFLSLPFLWPFLKSAREKLEDSAETVKDGVDRLRDINVKRYTKPIRKRWKSWTN